MSDKLSDKMDALYGGYAKTIAKQNCRIADLERQLAEAEGYPGIAHDFETVRRELEEARTEIANRAHTEEQYRLRIEGLERRLAAMLPMIEACKARTERHNPVVSTGRIEQCLCLTCQWYRDYEARKPK